MNVKYCASCGGKTEYVAKVPRFCGACGMSYASAFLAVPPVQSSPSAPVAPRSVPVATRALPSDAFVPRTNLTRRATQAVNDQDDVSGDETQLEDVKAEARQIAAAVSPADFGLNLISFGADNVTLGGILQNPERHQVGARTAAANQIPATITQRPIAKSD